MKNFNIIFVVPSLKTGGGNRVFVELANILALNHNVSIVYLCNSKEQNTFVSSDKVLYRGIGKYATNKIGKIINVFKCIAYLNKLNKDDKIIITDPLFSLFSFLLKNKKNIYRFIQADDYRIFDDGALLGKGVLLKIYKTLCLKSFKVKINYIFNSRFVYDNFLKDSRRNDVPYHLVHPALNHSIFREYDLKGQNTSPFQGCTLCLVARKHPLKGLNTFIEAYNNLPLSAKGRIKNVILVSHDDLSSFNTSGMEIVKVQNDNEIANVYRKSDIFISTSWWEGFGLPPLEAMACGSAVILSDSGGVNEYALPGKNCLMFKPKDVAGLQNIIIDLLDNPETIYKLSLEGIKSSKNFSWDKSAQQLIGILSLSK